MPRCVLVSSRPSFQKFGEFRRIVHVDELFDSGGIDPQLRESRSNSFPNTLAFLPLRQIEFRRQFRQLLGHDTFTVVVVPLNDLRLIGCMFHD